MKAIIVLSLYIILSTMATQSRKKSCTSYSIDDAKARNFTILGTVEGKTYFAEQTLIMTWEEANVFCNESRMHLATVTSKQQQRFLDYAHWSNKACYWTGGRDSQRPSQFAWEYSNQLLKSSVINFDWFYQPTFTCVYYCNVANSFESGWCGWEFNPLCEFMHGK